MELSRDQVLAITTTIDQLKVNKEALEEKLRKLKSDNESAYRIYGSELCAEEMIGKEKALEDQIVRIEREIKSISDFITGRINLDREHGILEELQNADREISELNDKKTALRDELRVIRFIQDILDKFKNKRVE